MVTTVSVQPSLSIYVSCCSQARLLYIPLGLHTGIIVSADQSYPQQNITLPCGTDNYNGYLVVKLHTPYSGTPLNGHPLYI